MLRRVLIALAIASGLGCTGGQYTTDATKKPADVVVTKGDFLRNALAEMRAIDINPTEDEAGIAITSNRPSKIFLIGDWGDALFLVATQLREGDPFVVSDLYWYKEWSTDSSRPHSERQRNVVHCDCVNLSQLLENHGPPVTFSREVREVDEDPFGA